jgi:Fe-S cluster assembly protein SufD
MNVVLPTPKLESWKYTSLKSLDDFAFARPGKGGVAPSTDAALVQLGARLVFVNGTFESALSQEAGPAAPLSLALDNVPEKVRPYLGKIATASEPLLALNAGVRDDGVALLMDGGTHDTVVVEHAMSGTGDGVSVHPRSLIVLKNGARATLVERFSGTGRYLINPVSEILLEDGAELTHIRLFEDSETAFNLSHLHANVGRDATYHLHIVSSGGALLRNQAQVDLAAPGASASLCAVYLARGRQHADHTTVIRHQAPHTTSRELFKGALDDQARGVFQGCIYVAKGADGADGHMTNKTLLLSDRAEIDSKPQLEIYADDVKCAHGATAGELEEEALFYMRARGIPETQARAMLVEGFLGEVFEDMSRQDLAEILRARVASWLRAAGLKEAA